MEEIVMFRKLKDWIKRVGRNIVYEGMEKYFHTNSSTIVTTKNNDEITLLENNQSLSKYLPYDLGYYSYILGPPIDNKKLENCKIISGRHNALPYMPKNLVCAEIGVAYGEFSEQILQIMQPKELHLIDFYCWGDFFGKDYFEKSGLNHEQYVTKKFENNENVIIKKGYSHKVLEKYPDDYFDYIYVDGGHDYDSVKKDISVLKRKVKNNGIIAFNDYTYFSMHENYEYGVLRAVNEFLDEGEHEILMYCIQPNKMDDLIVRLRK